LGWIPAFPLVRDVNRDNFGLLIAYLVPGFIVVWSLRPFLGDAQAWLGTAAEGSPTVGDFLYGTVAATAAGLVVSAVRWAVVDRLYHRTGVSEPRWDFAKLAKRLPVFETLVEYHYRYYQFYANTLVALVFTSGVALMQGRLPFTTAFGNVTLVLVVGFLIAASRDALKKYYRRVGDVVRAA